MKHKLFFYVCTLLVVCIGILAMTSFTTDRNVKGNLMVNSCITHTGIDIPTINPDQSEIHVTTKNVENITATTADCNYSVQVIGNTKINITTTGVRVIKIGTVGGPSVTGRQTGSDYKSHLSGLTPGSKYSVRAYATSSTTGTVYGTELFFATNKK